MELLPHLILPLLSEHPGTDHHAALYVSPRPQFLDQKTGHDCLSRTRIIGKEEAKRLTGEHPLVNACNLVGKGINNGRVNGKQRIKEVGQPNSVSFRSETEEISVSLEAPDETWLNKRKFRLALAIEETALGDAIRPLIRQLDGVGADPLDVDNGDGISEYDPADFAPRREAFKFQTTSPSILLPYCSPQFSLEAKRRAVAGLLLHTVFPYHPR
jgi:hypothetical protein